jgi:hypothetical protein
MRKVVCLLAKGLAVVIVLGFVGSMARQAVAQYTVVGTAQPVPGLTDNERLTYISPDGNYMLVTVGTFPNPTTASRTRNPTTGVWGAPVQVLVGNSSAAYLSPDRQMVYYQRPIGGVSEMFRSDWPSGANEQNLESLLLYGDGPVVNGNKLVLDGPNSSNGRDIFAADIAGDWFTNNPVALSSNVNTPYGDEMPWLSSDNKVLLFQSNRPGGYGGHDGWDLYQATWNVSQQTWTNATNLGQGVNTDWDEIWPRVAESAGKLFFTIADARYEHFQVMEVTVTPEPSTLALLGVSAVGLVAYAWRRRRTR